MNFLKSMKQMPTARILFAAALLAVCGVCLSVLFQRVNVSVHPRVLGSVIDSQTKEPISNAVIQFIGSDYGGGITRSTSKGSYDLPPVYHKFFAMLTWDVGFYTEIECSAPGYRSEGKRLSSCIGVPYLEHDTLYIDFELQRIQKTATKRDTDSSGEPPRER